MDPRQRQRLGWIVRFFALLLVLTLLARGTAGAAMASVTVQRPSSGNVTKSVRTTATVSFAGGTPFTVPAGLLVQKYRYHHNSRFPSIDCNRNDRGKLISRDNITV